MSLPGFEAIVRRFSALELPWVALGGGGYSVANVVRAWVLAWAVMTDAQLGDAIPESWLTEAATYGVAISSLRGSPSAKSKDTAQRVMISLDREIDQIRDRVFPLLRASSAEGFQPNRDEPTAEQP